MTFSDDDARSVVASLQSFVMAHSGKRRRGGFRLFLPGGIAGGSRKDFLFVVDERPDHGPVRGFGDFGRQALLLGGGHCLAHHRFRALGRLDLGRVGLETSSLMDVVTSLGDQTNDLSIETINIAADFAQGPATCPVIDRGASPQRRAVGGRLLGKRRTGEQAPQKGGSWFDPHRGLLLWVSRGVGLLLTCASTERVRQVGSSRLGHWGAV